MGNYIWVVLDERGDPIYCASYPEACHEHINDALMGDMPDNAGRWVVRRCLVESPAA